jgi:hypothetical protein
VGRRIGDRAGDRAAGLERGVDPGPRFGDVGDLDEGPERDRGAAEVLADQVAESSKRTE